MQDCLSCYGDGSSGKLQMANNAATSGLVICKIDVHSDGMAMVIGMLQDQLQDAIRTGAEDAFRARLLSYIARGRKAGDPRAGSWLENQELKCAPGYEKRCAEHGGDNWAHCRANHVKTSFMARQANFRRITGHNPGVLHPAELR